MEPFPPPSASQNYVTLHALSSGHLTLPEHLFVYPSVPGARNTVPSLSFLLIHTPPSSSTAKPIRILFDLGLRKNLKQYPSLLQEHLETRQPLLTTPDVLESLRKGGLEAGDVDYVVLSHVHWDHVGTPSDFKKSIFVVGNGSLGLLKRGEGGESHEFYEADLLPPERTVELPGVNEEMGKGGRGGGRRGKVVCTGFPRDCSTAMLEGYFAQSVGRIKALDLTVGEVGRGSVARIEFEEPGDAERAVGLCDGLLVDGQPLKLELVEGSKGGLFADMRWEKFGPLPNVIDIFSDGSLYLVDSPGHLEGHLNLLARVGPGKWVYLAGDACHDRRIMRGELEIGTWKNVHGEECCIHVDREATEKTIELIVGLEKMDGVEVVLAHDIEWLNEHANKERLWPGKL